MGTDTFGGRGYYVNTAGKKEKIEEYIRKQLQEDIANDQFRLNRVREPVRGEARKEKQVADRFYGSE